MLLGTTIRKLRMASGLSQAELARRARVSASFLSLVERDKREPTLSVLRRLADELRVPFGVILVSALGDFPGDPKLEEPILKLLEAFRLQLLTQAKDCCAQFPLTILYIAHQSVRS
jgi:transcriptional regulator with XRE-family HTH domain